MRRTLALALVGLLMQGIAAAAEMQGVIADWSCAKRMVKDGRQQTLKRDHSCSLVGNYNRPAYALITGNDKYYRLDGKGSKWARTLLRDSPDKDNLVVIVRGTIQGNTIQVNGMTEL